MSSDGLDGKRVVVTGAARGLGRAFVLELAGLGARVLAADVHADGVAETCALVREAGGVAAPATADVSSGSDTEALAAKAAEELGGVDALVNNAAVIASLRRRPFDEIAEEEWDRVLSVNVKGTWLCTRACLPLLRAGGGGSVVNLASEVAFSGSSGLAHYVASKAAVVGLTRALARELGPDGIRVNALAPGYVDSASTRELTLGVPYDTAGTPLGRVCTPDDLLGALVFLISDGSAFVTGQTLLVNGGRLVR